MPVLIDGYNLYNYVKILYAQQQRVNLTLNVFCEMIESFAKRTRQKITIIFDGTLPYEMKYDTPKIANVKLIYTGPNKSADEYLEEQIKISSAPKLLTIISSDREIISAAKKRKCQILTSDEFWQIIAKELTRKRPKPLPREKQKGLSSTELDYWLKTFQIDDNDDFDINE